MEWIKVSNRLPEYKYYNEGSKYTFVLAFAEDWGVNQVLYCNGVFHNPIIWEGVGKGMKHHNSFNLDVTDWMPLPEPPKPELPIEPVMVE